MIFRNYKVGTNDKNQIACKNEIVKEKCIKSTRLLKSTWPILIVIIYP